MIVQMIGIIAAQALVNASDPSGFLLFVIPSVLVSLAFTPILLSASPAPTFDTTQPMTVRRLMHISPLGCAGMLLTGGVFSALFGMVSVWGTMQGLTVPQISFFIAAIYVGGIAVSISDWLAVRSD